MQYHQRTETVNCDLETLLLKFYKAESITLFYQHFLDGVAGDTDLQDILGDSWLIHPPARLIKKTRVEALVHIFEDESLLEVFFSVQTELTKKVIHHLAWFGSTLLSDLEKLTGKRLATKNKTERSTWEPFNLIDGLELVQLELGYARPYSERKNKNNVIVYLPRALRETLREKLPKPREYFLHALPEKTKTTYTYCCESTGPTELATIIEYINQGHLALKKNGDPTIKGLRDLTQITLLKEFYPKGLSHKELDLLKIRLLTEFALSLEPIGTALSTLNAPDLLRRIFKKWTAHKSTRITDQFLDHIRSKSTYYSTKAYNVKKVLLKILTDFPAGGWISCDSIFSYCELRNINLAEQELHCLEYEYEVDSGYGTWKSWERVTSVTAPLTVYQPLLKFYFFLIAALGLMEIGYERPVNEKIHRKDREYLSPFDGLQCIRMTPLGRYVIGKSRSYDAVSQPEKAKVTFSLDPNRLILTMEGEDPILLLTLNKLLEPVGTGRFRITFQSLLQNCQTKQDVQRKINLFKTTICEKPPQNWLEFFRQALARVNPLQVETGLRLFKISADQELLHLLATDPAISSLLFKVEGLRIAVKLSNISKLIRELKKHGYLISNKSFGVN